MNTLKFINKYSNPATLSYFIVLAPFFNLFVLVTPGSSIFYHIVQALAYIYMLVTPGLFILPLVSSKKFPFALGVAFSVALTVFLLMISGLIVNTILPLLGNAIPLTTLPLLVAFDIIILSLFSINALLNKEVPILPLNYNKFSRVLLKFVMVLPVIAYIGALVLNNNGSNIPNMIVLASIFVLIPVIIFNNKKIDEDVLPIILYITALTFLLMNSLRGWFVTGHDILLEQHVFVLTNTMHLWSMEAFRDPYNACLSLTILPTFIQNLLHVDNNNVFKILFQFICAFPVVIVYYMNKKYTKSMVAFLTGLVFITFPSYMVDMAFLNRQGLAFLFFSLVVFTALNPDYFKKHVKIILMFTFGIGMILSHYSTSYVAVALFIGTYIVNKIVRFIMNIKRIKWLDRLTSRFVNKEIFNKPVLITLPFVVGIVACMLFWSVVITKTSSTLVKTVKDIAINIKHPFGIDDYWGPAKYSLINSKEANPQQLFNQYLQETTKNNINPESKENLYPNQVTDKYLSFPIYPVNEPLIPVTTIGRKIQSTFHMSLMNFFNTVKQLYAKIIQVFLLLGFIGLAIGYSFKKNVSSFIPSEFIALSVAGIVVMVAQTVLPANAIDYGLLRLFQQNLIFLSLPIICGMLAILSVVIKNETWKLFGASSILLFFYIILSGFLPQITGGGRPAMPLNNYGFYYDTYYTHAEEIASINWMKENADFLKHPIQSDHYFSNVKILTYANISTNTGLLSQNIKRDSYVYLNYNNVKTSSVIEFINGDVFYYHFPTDFLGDHKSLIYSNGGSEIYK